MDSHSEAPAKLTDIDSIRIHDIQKAKEPEEVQNSPPAQPDESLTFRTNLPSDSVFRARSDDDPLTVALRSETPLSLDELVNLNRGDIPSHDVSYSSDSGTSSIFSPQKELSTTNPTSADTSYPIDQNTGKAVATYASALSAKHDDLYSEDERDNTLFGVGDQFDSQPLRFSRNRMRPRSKKRPRPKKAPVVIYRNNQRQEMEPIPEGTTNSRSNPYAKGDRWNAQYDVLRLSKSSGGLHAETPFTSSDSRSRAVCEGYHNYVLSQKRSEDKPAANARLVSLMQRFQALGVVLELFESHWTPLIVTVPCLVAMTRLALNPEIIEQGHGKTQSRQGTGSTLNTTWAMTAIWLFFAALVGTRLFAKYSDTRFEDAPNEVLATLEICLKILDPSYLGKLSPSPSTKDFYHKGNTAPEGQAPEGQEIKTSFASEQSGADKDGSNSAKQIDLTSNKAQKGSNASGGDTDSDRLVELDLRSLNTTILKFLIVCFPNDNGSRMQHMQIKQEVADAALISTIKAEYNLQRGFWSRISRLRAFHAIRLARFELRHTSSQLVPTDIEWAWPTEGNIGWEFTKTGPLSVEGLSKFMTHLWLNTQEHGEISNPKRPQKQKKRSLRLKLYWKESKQSLPVDDREIPRETFDSFPWLRMASCIRIFLPKFPQRESSPGDAAIPGDQTDDSAMSWIRNTSIEVDYGSNLVHPRFIYHRTPKKLRERLTLDPNGEEPPIGWAIWIDEDFAVHWSVLIALNIISLGLFVFAIVYTAKSGQKANGWTIGSCAIALVNIVFTSWVLRSKDSKHARA
ncbi:hypothetical protein N0V90_005873 [Kalmusia sp. IMI 367209]|nr:hypothetical protein N0V90_005873 [Kalmusia sp. IMI 367209]